MVDPACAAAIWCLRWGALLAGLGVILGAFGAHGLRDHLSPTALNWYQTAVHYHLIHALGVLAAGWAAGWAVPGWACRAAWFFVAGIALFCGSLYAMALTGRTVLGMVTPLGGACFIAGWVLLALSAAPAHRKRAP